VTGLFLHFTPKSLEDLDYLRVLASSLMVSGIAMEIAGSSRPASGAEHLIRHAYDQVASPASLHGLQVGAASYLTAHLQGTTRDVVVRAATESGFLAYLAEHPLSRSAFTEALERAPSIKEGFHTVLAEPGALEQALAFCESDPWMRQILARGRPWGGLVGEEPPSWVWVACRAATRSGWACEVGVGSGTQPGQHGGMSRGGVRPLYWFAAIYLVTFTVAAVSPWDRGVWWAENLPILGIFFGVLWLSRHHEFSPTAYGAMLVLLVMHTIGGHYTFERVPFGWVTNLFGFQRNHYDRVAHFSVGFYAYPIAELLYRKGAVNRRWVLLLFPVFAILSVAALYELFEWQYAVLSDPTAGVAVLGSQGDVWDAQKDMLSDGLGAIVATALFAWRFRGAAAPG